MAQRAQPQDQSPAAAFHVVAVDDNGLERQALAALVRAEGYRVTEAGGGREALALLVDDPAVLVITELFMAGIDGWDLLDRVKQTYPQTHVVLVTGNITEQGEALLASRKVDGYLIKPVQARPLQILCRALLAPGNLDRAAEVVAVSGDQALLEQIDATLAGRGVLVHPFTSVRKAAAHLWDDPPDLVLVGTKLGPERGFDLCQTIRSSPDLPALPILLLADTMSPRHVRRAVELRINGVLLTPFGADVLIKRVFKLLRRD